MRLSDIMSQMGLAGYAEVGLLIFVAVFVAIGARLVFSSKSEMDEAARLPLTEDTDPAGTSGAKHE